MIDDDRELRAKFLKRAALRTGANVRDIVEAVRAIPHGRPAERSAHGVIESWRGTCSTKLLLLQAIAPELDLRFINRVFTLTQEDARKRLGERAASVVPPEGLVDVHTYATGLVGGRRVILDVTFPGGPPWDGRSDMQIPWPEGEDFRAGGDPIAAKEGLVARFGDARARARLIAAIS